MYLIILITFISSISFCNEYARAKENYKHGADFKPSLIYPVKYYKIIDKFGWEKFNSSNFKSSITFEKGNKKVFSAANGKVIISGFIGSEGVIIIKSEDYYTVYKGIQDFFVGKNKYVIAGQLIGGMHERSKLRFEVRDDFGNSYDPENYFLSKKAVKIKVKGELYRTFFAFMNMHGFTEKQIPIMYCIANLESSFNPKAINYNRNKTFDTGLFQINDIWLKKCNVTRKELFDVRKNAACARIVLLKQGFNAWVTYKKFYPHRCS
ncbi:M23 family metallopeptidase [Fluviispira sanaruensis]|uniref:M23ase beta-sheet core domain-containing protein n=1 Tax=Fluviispira sanaruensis TaxID=2493639 RepID=A0A4P2VQM2_FLUSA|nr:M23 family metallopeptidase [Fluviispira sanaruensis]BBH54720.1 hypothetical protein JCM31447_31940 [Fluviispira sanaruensis]